MLKATGTDKPVDSSGETQPAPSGVDAAPASAQASGLKLGSLKLDTPTPAPEPVAKAGGVPSLPLGGGFKLKVAGATAAATPDPSPNPATDSVVAEPQPNSADESQAPVGLTLSDISQIDTDLVGIPGIEQAGADLTDSEGYLDQVPAAAPIRDLPTELDKQQKAFIDSLDSIYRLHDDPEMFVNMVRRIMSEMQDRPELMPLLAPGGEDSNALIRGLRQSAGLAQVKKTESKAKRGNGGGRAKPQSAMVDSAMKTLQGLAGLEGFD